ncbi:DUF2334 domain-containing protein [Candidatus Pacearchaeota archaeon]|nr:DUF2334 domain-containing protein [Candidatus Pacearchaeota archaeon]
MKKKILIPLLIILLFVFTLFLIRLTSPREIDDVSPEILCEQKYLEKSDILWIIPKFNNKSISENKTWCQKILSLNKTLGLHGVYHEFEEFNTNRNQKYLQEGINIFEECFGFKPEMFKPPQLKISNENKKLIKGNNMKLKLNFNQLTHKVYHCDDSGTFPNWVVDLF